MLKKISTTAIGILLIYGAASISIKAAIGVTPVDATMATLTAISGLKMGGLSILFQSIFFLGQIALERKNFRKAELLQIVYILLGGYLFNFFIYTVLSNVVFHTYLTRLISCILAYVFCSLGCILVIDSKLMRIPVEGFAQVLADRKGLTLGRVKQILDFLLILLCVALTLIFRVDWTLREGTIIAAMIFGPLMDMWRKIIKVLSK